MSVENPPDNVPAPEPRPFKPDITGDLRTRLFRYAREKGRSATNAVKWLLGEALRKEGY